MSTTQDNEAVVRACFETAVRGDFAALDAILTPDYVLHAATSPEDVHGAEGLKDMVEMYRSAVGGMRLTIDHQFATGDHVATRFTVRGTHAGELLGVPATGRDVTCHGITVSRCRDGRIAEEWEITDALGLLRQVGGLPEMAQT